jgi:excisionase family DNA binding protein
MIQKVLKGEVMAGKKKRTGRKGKKKKAGGASQRRTRKSGDLLSMEQAIEMLGTTRPTFYRWLRSGRIKGMKVGRQWRFTREDIERFLKGEAPRIDLPADIDPLLEALGGKMEALGVERKPPKALTGTDKVVEAVNRMILLALSMDASDIHLSPQYVEGKEVNVGMVRVRIDGVLHPLAEIDLRVWPAVVDRWKVMAACDLHEKEKPQDGRILIGEPNRADLRVSFLPTCLGEAITVRVLKFDVVELCTLERINFSERDREQMKKWLAAPWGVVVVTGPTGCGKTTTIYAALREVTRPEVKTITIEDPVEALFPWMEQVQVRPAQGLTFPALMRAVMRSDPDVIFVGEIRDAETLKAVQQMALTGHLVFTVLHAPEAAKALIRMVEVGGDPFVVGEAVKLVVSQRLIRCLCPECSTPGAPSVEIEEKARVMAREAGLDWLSLPKEWRRPAGCPACSQTGYRGRDVIAETLELSSEIAGALKRGADADEIRRIAVTQGMVPMVVDGIGRAARGETTLAEVVRVLGLR